MAMRGDAVVRQSERVGGRWVRARCPFPLRHSLTTRVGSPSLAPFAVTHIATVARCVRSLCLCPALSDGDVGSDEQQLAMEQQLQQQQQQQQQDAQHFLEAYLCTNNTHTQRMRG